VDVSLILASDVFSFLSLVGHNPNPIDLTLFRCVLRVSTVTYLIRAITDSSHH
jgi:hypothetical protein